MAIYKHNYKDFVKNKRPVTNCSNYLVYYFKDILTALPQWKLTYTDHNMSQERYCSCQRRSCFSPNENPIYQ